MNRQQRRAAEKQTPAAAAAGLFREGAWNQAQGQLAEAVRLYKKVTALIPEWGEAHNNLGVALMALGRSREAAASFAKVLETTPELLDEVPAVLDMLAQTSPQLVAAAARANEQWPRRLASGDRVEKDGTGIDLDTIADDPLLLTVLRSAKIRDLALERLWTELRREWLLGLGNSRTPDPALLALQSAVAEQCFITEYIYPLTSEETDALARLTSGLAAALSEGERVDAQSVIVAAMYQPLRDIPNIGRLAKPLRDGPLRAIYAQQVSEPAAEQALRDNVPALTPIDDAVSIAVRDQYEENPYPRWVHAAAPRRPVPLSEHLQQVAAEQPIDLSLPDPFDALVAGCGTGRLAIELTQKLRGARTLAIDLSRASLAYAIRKTPKALAGRIDYAQADILQLGTLQRRFDLISAGGVLHHMADPVGAWKILTDLLRPGGVMHIGLYSETARQGVVAARAFIAERGFGTSADDIRQCRQDLIAAQPDNPVIRWGDFYSLSDCRDLLFHVQEQRFTLPKIKAALSELGLAFVGFDMRPAEAEQWRKAFAAEGRRCDDLDRWNEIEQTHPGLFASMYQFWVRKPATG